MSTICQSNQSDDVLYGQLQLRWRCVWQWFSTSILEAKYTNATLPPAFDKLICSRCHTSVIPSKIQQTPSPTPQIRDPAGPLASGNFLSPINSFIRCLGVLSEVLASLHCSLAQLIPLKFTNMFPFLDLKRGYYSNPRIFYLKVYLSIHLVRAFLFLKTI